jgi:hypothetical protein
MIFTIGFQKLPLGTLERILGALDALLIDVRSHPMSRKPGYSGKALRERFGDNYLWMGDHLGGHFPITEYGLGMLEPYDNHLSTHCLLLCLEEAPGECHRHHAICGPHFPQALHIYQDMLIPAYSLAEAIEADIDEYDYYTLADFGLEEALS